MSLSVQEFLLRRQFLAFERKRTGLLYREAQASLKQQSAQLSSMEGRLFGKQPSSQVVKLEDRSSWQAPSARVTYAWSIWSREFKRIIAARKMRFDSEKLQFAFVVSGGIGDVLKSSAIIPELVKAFDCEVTFVTDQAAALAIFDGNPYVTNTLIVECNPFNFSDDCLSRIDMFDAVVVWKYLVEYFITPSSRLSQGEKAKLISTPHKIYTDGVKYCHSNEIWPRWNYSFHRTMIRHKLSVTEVSAVTSGVVETRAGVSIPLYCRVSDVNLFQELIKTPYVTIHHGFDLNNLPKKERPVDYISTKNISVPKWTEIVTSIRNSGLDVIQLGIAAEDRIPGVSHYLNGQTSLGETALLLKYGVCHIDTEGGLVHLNRAVHGRSVVMFGPTPVEVFGYPQNVNLEPHSCKGCWFATETWMGECPRHTSGPQCMLEHSAARVVEAVNLVIQDQKVVVASIIATDSRTPASRLAAATAEVIRDVRRAPRASGMFVCDPAGYRFLKSLPKDLLENDRIVVCRDSDDPVYAPEGGLQAVEFGSLINLSNASRSVEVVVCLSDSLGTQDAPFVLREMLRVIKPGGVLIAAIPSGAGATCDVAALVAAAGFECDTQSALEQQVSLFALRIRETDRRRFSPLSITSAEPTTACHQSESPFPSPPGLAGSLTEKLDGLENSNAVTLESVHRVFVERERTTDKIWSAADDLAQRAIDRDGWIGTGETFGDNYARHFLVEGWHGSEPWGCWGDGANHTMVLPLRLDGTIDGVVELEVDFDLLLIDGIRTRTVSVLANEELIERWFCTHKAGTRKVRIPMRYALARSVLVITFQVDIVVNPKHAGINVTDDRGLGLGLKRFRYRHLVSVDDAGRENAQHDSVTTEVDDGRDSARASQLVLASPQEDLTQGRRPLGRSLFRSFWR